MLKTGIFILVATLSMHGSHLLFFFSHPKCVGRFNIVIIMLRGSYCHSVFGEREIKAEEKLPAND